MMYHLSMKITLIALLLLFCLGLTGCAGSFPDAMCKDDAGIVQHGETEFSWVIINSFRLVFDHPGRFLLIIALTFALLFAGGALWGAGQKFLGAIVIVAGAVILATIFTLAYFVLAMVLGVVFSGFLKR